MEFVAFDLETTGLSSKSDRIIEIGAVRFDESGTTLADFEILVEPGIPLPLGIQRLTGISESDLIGQVSPVEAVAQLADFSDGAILVAHGAQFDMAHCLKLAPDTFGSRTVLDTLTLARIVLPQASSHGLGNLAKELTIEHSRPHRALPDAVATGLLLVALANHVRALPQQTREIIKRLVSLGGDAALTAFFEDMVPRGTSSISTERTVRAEVPSIAGAFTPQPADLESSAVAMLSADGPVASQTEYEYRDAQLEMTRTVAQALERKKIVLIEAQTGVGKSMAYLAPLMLWAGHHGNRAVVATHTINLQEQLARNDADRINSALAERIDVAVLKGRNHYLSLRRWNRFLHGLLAGHPSLAEVLFALKVVVWLTSTTTGDRGELRLSSSESELWRNIRSDSDDCLGGACENWRSAECPMVAARQHAARADLVITNHALLLAGGERQGTILADYQALVIDEGHRLEESATRQFGIRVRAVDVNVVLTGLPESWQERPLLAQSFEASKRLFGDIKGFLSGTGGSDGNPNVTLTLNSDTAERHPNVGALHRASHHAVQVWSELASDLDSVAPDHADHAQASLSAAALRDLCTSIRRVMENQGDSETVSWLELRAEQAEMHQAPVDVAHRLRHGIFDTAATTVLTSATLRTYGGFEFLRQRLGIPPSADEIALESTFDYLNQALCIIPSDIPPYDDERYDRSLAEMVADCAHRIGGRTLALFTGYGALRRIADLVEREVSEEGIAVLAQGIDGTRRQLVESFKASDRTVLCGTNSFWEGIDIPGDALQCVVIAKLPFPVPSDPVVAARCAELSDPFRQYALPQAVLRLRQGFGHLIRRAADRGTVVLCDSRLRDRSYARAFFEALPECRFARVPLSEVGMATHRFIRDGTVPEGTEYPAQERQLQQRWLQTSLPGSDEPA